EATRLAKAGQHLFGAQGTEPASLVPLWLRDGRRRCELVRVAIRNLPDQPFDIQTICDKLVGHFLEERRMTRGLVVAEIVNRVHKTAAHKLRPDTVDAGAGEVRVLRRGNPLGKLFLAGEAWFRQRLAFLRLWLLEVLRDGRLREGAA